MNNRNGSIDLIKFLLAISLVAFHARGIMEHAPGQFGGRGASAVEGFFIIAGLFMAHTALSKQTEPFPYVKKRYFEIFPQHIFAFIFAFIVTCMRRGFDFPADIVSIVKLGVLSVPEFFLFAPLSGLQFDLASVNGIEWYLSAMLLGMALIYPFLRKFKENYCLYIGPLVFLFFSGFLYQMLGSYRGTYDITVVFCNGLLRAIAMMSLGTFVYGLVLKTRDIMSDKRSTRVLVTVFSVLCWAVSFYYLHSMMDKYFEFAIVYFMAGGVFFSYIGLSYLKGLFSNKFVRYLGKLSLPMFLNQGWIRKAMIDHNFGETFSFEQNLLIFSVSVIVISIICLLVTEFIMKKIRAARAARAGVSQ